MVLRILIFITVVYFIYRILGKLITPFFSGDAPRRVQKRGKNKDIPPPYDPNAVEDIDYVEIKKKRKSQ